MSELKRKSRFVFTLLCLLFLNVFLASCDFINKDPAVKKSEDIIILYTNDVHANYTQYIGYSGLSAYKKEMEQEYEYVTLLDNGDAIQGDLISLFLKGQNVIELMNEVGYDLAVLGNHEFDYGLDATADCINKFEGTYITANIDLLKEDINYFDEVEPYKILEYGDKKVGFIGLASTLSITSSTPTYFMDENGMYIVNFWSITPELFYSRVQEVVDEVKFEGAEYIVICSHLGDVEGNLYNSINLIQNINGVDVLLDGHAHSTIEQRIIKDKDNNEVILSSTGTGLENIGKLTITTDGEISTELIKDYNEKDPDIDEYIALMEKDLEDLLNEVVSTNNTPLSIYDDEGVRMVRNRETTIGNLCADALRIMFNANIGIINGGGVRSSLPSGDITYRDLYNVFPFGDKLVFYATTGQVILDALELSVSKVQKEYKMNGEPIGEDGSFLQVSGVKFDVDTSIESTVVLDENEMFVEVAGERRVKNCLVRDYYGEYLPIDPNAFYLVSSTDYLLLQGGGGYSMFKEGYLIHYYEDVKDIQVLVNYLHYLNGDLSMYQETDNRINIY